MTLNQNICELLLTRVCLVISYEVNLYAISGSYHPQNTTPPNRSAASGDHCFTWFWIPPVLRESIYLFIFSLHRGFVYNTASVCTVTETQYHIHRGNLILILRHQFSMPYSNTINVILTSQSTT